VSGVFRFQRNSCEGPQNKFTSFFSVKIVQQTFIYGRAIARVQGRVGRWMEGPGLDGRVGLDRVGWGWMGLDRTG
jgi:hypothetical protein